MTTAPDMRALFDARDPDRYDLHSRHLNNQMVRVLKTIGFTSSGIIALVFAEAAIPCLSGAAVGLATDAAAQLLDHQGLPIHGLYACGNDMNSIMNGAYPAPGITLGPALVFAYIAVAHAASVEVD